MQFVFNLCPVCVRFVFGLCPVCVQFVRFVSGLYPICVQFVPFVSSLCSICVLFVSGLCSVCVQFVQFFQDLSSPVGIQMGTQISQVSYVGPALSSCICNKQSSFIPSQVLFLTLPQAPGPSNHHLSSPPLPSSSATSPLTLDSLVANHNFSHPLNSYLPSFLKPLAPQTIYLKPPLPQVPASRFGSPDALLTPAQVRHRVPV